MKKLTLIIFIISFSIGSLSSNQIIGGPGQRLGGFAPQDTLIVNINATLRIPARIGLYVDANIGWDLYTPATGSPSQTYPPTVFPGYYYPNTASTINPQGVYVQVFSNSATMTWFLEIRGSGNFHTTIPISQLLVAPDGSTPPSEGQLPSAPWLSLSTQYQQLNSGGKTNGWASYPKDFLFVTDEDDEPGNYSVTVSFRLYAQ
ncbi:MAG: hypothetical protein ABDH37_01115 [Candidatus Hydrothermales bacterium]